jgi:hypothetical protein
MYFSMAISELDQGFLAGFFEGEASFAIREQNGGQSHSCAVRVVARDDDQDLLEWLAALTGLGRLYRTPAQRTSRPQIGWTITAQDDCIALIRLLSHCGFHGRRTTELEIWSEAVRVWTGPNGSARRARLDVLKRRLHVARQYARGHATATPFSDRERPRLGYISGLVCAEGCFHFSGTRPRFSMHLRHDDRPLLELLAASTGMGRIYDHHPGPPLNPSSTWTVGARAELVRLVATLRDADLPCRKRTQLETWSIAVDELQRAHRERRRPRKPLLELSSNQLRELRTYRPSTREVVQFSRRDVPAECLAALKAWATAADGRLACTGYVRWRREHPERPTRNTVAGAFGSWYAAMEAAGLASRAARRGASRAGGEERRAARREEQRASVIAAVRRFEAAHDRMPRAMEFFKWRLDAAPESPTQATVYKLFRGGWEEVLAAATGANLHVSADMV